jgi:hypothetical protein
MDHETKECEDNSSVGKLQNIRLDRVVRFFFIDDVTCDVGDAWHYTKLTLRFKTSFSFIEAKIYTYSVRVKFLCDLCASFVFNINPHLINYRDLLIHLYKGVVPVFFDILIKVGIFCEISRSFLVFGFLTYHWYVQSCYIVYNQTVNTCTYCNVCIKHIFHKASLIALHNMYKDNF